jgi:poly(A) polymerase
MKDFLKTLATEFNSKGFNLYEVGGSVRDSLMKRTPHDWDLTTDATPDQIHDVVDNLGYPVYTVGEKFGTIALDVNGNKVEITTYRDEVYTSNSRKPQVTYGKSLIKDLSRRDFTIGAVARNPKTGAIVDPFGGQDDIIKRVVKCVGDDDARFDEDPLRMLRAVRFACQLGFKLEVTINHPERLRIVSKERVRDEFVKIILTDRASWGLKRLCQFGLMDYIFPEFVQLQHIAQGKNHIKDAFDHSLLVLTKGSMIEHGDDTLVFRLACMLHDIGKPETKREDETGVHFYNHHNVGAAKARIALRRLRFDNDIIDRVDTLVGLHMAPIILNRDITDGTIKKKVIMRLVRKAGENNIDLLMDLVKCDIRSSNNPRYKFMTILQRLVKETLAEHPCEIKSPIDGNEIMAEFNFKPTVANGKLIGSIKEYLCDMVINGELGRDDKNTAFDEARKFMEVYNLEKV